MTKHEYTRPQCIYFAHPYGGEPENIARAESWLTYLSGEFAIAPIATWTTLCRHWAEDRRALGLDIDRALVELAGVLVACGGWSPGVRQEAGWARVVVDLTDLTRSEPSGLTLRGYAELTRRLAAAGIAAREPQPLHANAGACVPR